MCRFYLVYGTVLLHILYTFHTGDPTKLCKGIEKGTILKSVDFFRKNLIDNTATLPAEMFGGSDFWLETRVIIKISKKMIPHSSLEKQKQNFFFLFFF